MPAFSTKLKNFYGTYCARPEFGKFNEFLLELALRGLGLLNCDGPAATGERHFLRKILPLYIGALPATCLDVGVHDGAFCEELLNALERCSIFAFEPNPTVFEKLILRFPSNGPRCEMLALGSSVGMMQFYDRMDQSGGSEHGTFYKGVISQLHKAAVIEKMVPATTIDIYSQQIGLKHINFLKIDTEGHELEVLKGAQQMLQDSKVDVIQIEFNEMNIISRVFYSDFTQLLENYWPYRLLPNGVLPLGRKVSSLKRELFGFQNIVFVHDKFQPDGVMRPRSNAFIGRAKDTRS